MEWSSDSEICLLSMTIIASAEGPVGQRIYQISWFPMNWLLLSQRLSCPIQQAIWELWIMELWFYPDAPSFSERIIVQQWHGRLILSGEKL